MDARIYLLQVAKHDAIVQNKLDELARWKEAAVDVTSHISEASVKKSGISDKVGNSVAKYLDLDAEIMETINTAMLKRKEIIETIELLPVNEYDLLYKLYVRGMTLYEAVSEMDRSYSWGTTMHSRALKNLQNIINKDDE